MQITDKLIEQLQDSDTALVANALNSLGFSQDHTLYLDGSIQCQTPGFRPLVGEVITVSLDCSSPGEKGKMDQYWDLLEEIQGKPHPVVVVVKSVGGDIKRACVAGDGMAKTMVSVGATGLVTDGGVRDLEGIVAQNFSVFASGLVIHHTPLRWSGLGAPVMLGGIEVKTGDLLHGNDGGCLVIPEPNWPYIAEACRIEQDKEKRSHLLMRQSGVSVAEKKAFSAENAERNSTDMKELIQRIDKSELK